MSTPDNLTAVLYKVNDLRLEQRPIPVPKDDELLLEMACVGICGSDVSYLVKGRIGDFVVRQPMICGHEASGTVKEVGKNVKNFKIGDRVAIEPGVPCRGCNFCKQGDYHLCADIVFCATPPVHGNLTRYYTHAADFCYKLPENVSLEEGALLEPLSVGVHACRKASVTLGSNVLINGAGPIGIVTLIAAKAFGAAKVVITDIQESRLAQAKEFGADGVILVTPESSVTETAKQVVEIIGDEPNKAIDCSGAEFSVQLAIQATKAKGAVVLVGMGPPEMKLPVVQVVVKEIQIFGSFRYANDSPRALYAAYLGLRKKFLLLPYDASNYQLALDLVATKKADVTKMITHRFKLEETKEAFEMAKTGKALKVMIDCKKN